MASDIAVEEMIESLGAPCLNTPESSERRDELKRIKAKRGRLSVDRLYKSFVNDLPIEAEVGLMRELFTVDDHCCGTELIRVRISQLKLPKRVMMSRKF